MIAILLFVFYLVFDFLYAHYIMAVGDHKAFKAATISAILIIMSLYGTIEVIKNYWMIIPVVAGSFLGTFLTVRLTK